MYVLKFLYSPTEPFNRQQNCDFRNTFLRLLNALSVNQASLAVWGKNHLRHFAASLTRGPVHSGASWGDVSAQRTSCRSQPDKMHPLPPVCAATVTAGGHGEKAPRISCPLVHVLHLWLVSAEPKSLGVRRHNRHRVHRLLLLQWKAPRTKLSLLAQAALLPLCFNQQGCTPSLL